MRKAVVWILTLLFIFHLTGCGKSNDELPQMETDNSEHSETETAQDTSGAKSIFNRPVEVIVSNDLLQRAFFATGDGEASAVELGLLNEENNNISAISQWAEKNQLILQRQNEEGISFYDDNFSYRMSEYGVEILEKETLNPLYSVSFKKSLGEDYGNWACLDNGILFVGQYYNGYASTDTCYIMEIELDTGDILWRSEDQTFNSHNFIVKEDVIICGYGFTAEPDYIYQLDKMTGEVISVTPVKTAADCLVIKDHRLYVHTYNTDYVFSLGGN